MEVQLGQLLVKGGRLGMLLGLNRFCLGKGLV